MNFDVSTIDSNDIFYFPGAEFLTTANGCQRLLLQGHVFLVNRVIKDRVFWVCGNYHKTKCKCRCSLYNGGLTRSPAAHNHAPPPADLLHKIYSNAASRTVIYSSAIRSDIADY